MDAELVQRFPKFCEWLSKEDWLNSNSLVAVAGGNDGPSGLQKDSGWTAVQEEIWRFADIIFSPSPASRLFWLLKDEAGREKALKLGAPKPCLHGCDAHSMETLFLPDLNRFCWVKADPTFEGLRQTLYEPDGRVHIGVEAPSQHDASQVISSVTVSGGASLAFGSLQIPINAGLVTIIGSKGSGKSALADLISYAAGVEFTLDKRSFLKRAAEYIQGTEITLTWANGEITSAVLPKTKLDKPMVRYLSQSFVEKLCSDDYHGGDLAQEIENVIFRNLDPTDTLNASSFRDLRELRTKDTEKERIDLAAQIKSLIAQDENLRQVVKSSPEKRKRIEELTKENTALEKQLPAATTAQELAAQEELAGLRKTLLQLQTTVAGQKQVALRLEQLVTQLERFREQFSSFRSTFLSDAASLGVTEGLDVELKVIGEDLIAARSGIVSTQILRLEQGNQSSDDPYIDGTIRRIAVTEKAVAADQVVRARIQQLQKKLSANLQEIQRLQSEIMRAEGEVTAKIIKGREERLDTYEALFKSWKREQVTLERLYEPVQKKLATGEQEEKKLDFYMKWDIDLDSWLERGNSLFDSRKGHPFGTSLQLRETIEKTIMPGWSSGDRQRFDLEWMLC